PPRSKRSGIYSFETPMSICSGHLFFQCIIVYQLRLHLNKQTTDKWSVSGRFWGPFNLITCLGLNTPKALDNLARRSTPGTSNQNHANPERVLHETQSH